MAPHERRETDAPISRDLRDSDRADRTLCLPGKGDGSPPAARRRREGENHMLDAALISIAVLFFVGAAVYTRACDRL